jgi:phenylacetate-CoA ligase
MFAIPKSNVSMVEWPALPEPTGALLLAILRQFDESERLPPADLEALQFRTLTGVLRHACDTVPYYRDRPVYREVLDAGPLDAAAWQRLPLLTREDLQDAGGSTTSDSIPADHHPLSESITSGSTGRPVRTLGTRVTSMFWHSITLREHVWRGRDSTSKLVAIRAEGNDKIPPEGRAMAGWGSSISVVFPDGPCAMLGISHDIAHQARWLVSENPDYLLSLPSNLAALARHFQVTGTRLERLRGLTTYGETVGPDVREACRAAWGVEIADIYSSQEAGYIALQCPQSEALHVQAESVYVEVLDDDDSPCRPGEVGRVVVSTLQNYAMPLVRYEVGDCAEVGTTCPCGRTLPLLERVVGRRRNMLRLPTGETMWPRLPAHEWAPVAPIRQLQVVQDELDHIEARIVSTRPLTADEEGAFTAVLCRLLKYPFRVSLTYLERVDRSRERKFDDFVSRL